MKNKVEISAFWTGALLALLGIFLAAFFGMWFYNSTELKRLAVEESNLQKEISEWEKYRKWTLDYAQIYIALDIISKKQLSERQKAKLSSEIWVISRNYGFDPLLIPSIVFQESRGNPYAKGRFRSGAESGAYGLMQLKVPTAQAIGKRFGLRVERAEDLMRPEVSIVVGSAYLMRLVGRYGDLKKAIVAYNMGQGSVDAKIRDRSPIPSFYYEEVLAKYRKLRQLVGERMGDAE